MARLNKFDKEIKNKMNGLQGEPSARVWAGVRTAVPASNAGISPWYYRAAAALLLLGIIGSAAWYMTRESGENAGSFTNGSGQDSVQVDVPKTPAPAPQRLLVQDDASGEALPEQEKTDQFEKEINKSVKNDRPEPSNSHSHPLPDFDNQGIVQEEQQNVKEKDQEDKTPELQVPNDILPQEFPQEELPNEVIVEDYQVPVEEIPEEAPIEIKGDQPETSRSSRRQYALSDLKQISREDVRKKSGAVLGNLAKNASEALGIETEIKTESLDETHEKKEFATRIGPISFKRVRKVKK